MYGCGSPLRSATTIRDVVSCRYTPVQKGGILGDRSGMRRSCRFCRMGDADGRHDIRPDPGPVPGMLTVGEVATLRRVHPRSIQRWAHEGRVGSVRVGRGYRIPRADVLRGMLAARRAVEDPPVPID